MNTQSFLVFNFSKPLLCTFLSLGSPCRCPGVAQ